MSPVALIDLEAYPIHEPGGRPYAALLKRVRGELAEDGCSVLRNFVSAESILRLTEEADRTAPHGHRSFNRTNAYFTRDDLIFPQRILHDDFTTARTRSYRRTISAQRAGCVPSTNGARFPRSLKRR